jgi:hypothetical protein
MADACAYSVYEYATAGGMNPLHAALNVLSDADELLVEMVDDDWHWPLGADEDDKRGAITEARARVVAAQAEDDDA